ncbi:hypothetical protein AMAG_04430 [Allomyces macrogynus ATCC 38327]|uniref:FAD-binding FR-type domain-containing protein n=1 Tax=Allomyces macrogynus (strain ATCC 38327) TaxID=578462 RepID=A0A0L0S8U0_ALLM3|nr:hypothetical protein AMAG_04430 [Allomyces macrogynus ATCC 38327]|eukprot:KNE58892.1 hypothetical protein AMAG_04430 [Allomyces macrogynus ATCC 38327]
MPGTHPRPKPPETVVDIRLRDANVLSRDTLDSPSSGNALIGSRSHLANGPNYKTVVSLVGDGIPAAKAAAACLNWNSAIILLPVCRTLISKLRVTVLSTIIPFDKSIAFHRHVGYAIVLFTWIHVMAHIWNYRVLGLATMHSAEWYALVSGPGLTGQVATLALFLMATAAAQRVRRAHFEIFWYSHHLFLVYIAALLPHGAYCFVKSDTGKCSIGGNFWKYIRLLREIAGRRATQIVKVVLHPANVVELRIEKPSAPRMRPGQYVWLNVPSVAAAEWHPFTLTSAPDDAYYSVHMRVVGDWTRSVAQACGVSFTDDDWTAPAVVGQAAVAQLPEIMMDGPYGAAAEDWMRYDVVLLVGAGIGVTPYASILKHLHWLAQKVHFVWVCRDANAFEWFQARLHALEVALPDLVELHMYLTAPLTADQITNVVIHDMTVAAEVGDDSKHGGGGAEPLRDAVVGLRVQHNTMAGRIGDHFSRDLVELHIKPGGGGPEAVRDAVSGLASNTYYGRPHWPTIFEGLTRSYPSTDIGVFCCGPKPLSHELHALCNQYTMVNKHLQTQSTSGAAGGMLPGHHGGPFGGRGMRGFSGSSSSGGRNARASVMAALQGGATPWS